MRMLIQWMAGLTVAAGLVLVGWGPMVFEAVTGTTLPAPAAGDPSRMASWAVMGLVRVFGAALIVIGALARGLMRRRFDGVSLQRALCVAGGFGFAIAAIQAVAVWLAPVGVLIALPFAVVVLATWPGAEWGRERGRVRISGAA
jgi:hypothetical protein